MSNHAPEDPNGPGYFLPEDSQFRLLKLSRYMDFLSRLAQPRRSDEAEEFGPEFTVGELAICLEQLAEQAELVLEDVVWRSGEATADATDADEADEVEDDDEAESEVQAYAHADDDGDTGDDAIEVEADAVQAFPPDRHRCVVGVTVAQIDALDRLVRNLLAHGDVISASGSADLAEHTLPLLGHAVYDGALALREILDTVGTQRLEAAGRRPRSGLAEARGMYMVGRARSAADTPSGPVRPRLAAVPGHVDPPGSLRLH